MDATPPPAPPTLVSAIDQAQREALARMAAFQSWLLAQQDALPDPAIAAQDKREFFHDIDTFWDISHEGSSRRPLFARHMAQAMRDDAGLRAASGDLSYKDIELVRQLTDIAATLPRHVHASELMVGGTPYPGALVAWDDARSDDILLFLPDQGWSVYDTLDGLLYDMADRMHEQARMANGRPPYAVTGDNEAVLAIRPIDSDVVATLTDGLIVHFRTLQQEAWDANPDTSSRIDALHDTLRLFMLVDPHALLDGVDLLLANRRAAPTHARCSPPASTARTIIRGTGRHLGVAGGRVGVQASRTLFHRVGTGLPGRLPASRSVSPLAPSNTLFNERYVAHGVTMPANAPQIDGVFLVGNARYVRQGNQLYAVRFDSSLRGWRLQRHGALDAQYAGPPIRRAADGSWELWQDAGLLGGAPRKDVPRWQQLDRLTDEQRRRLQSVLAERLGLDEGGALYRRMAARPPEGIRSLNMPRAYRDIWREAMEAALPPASPPGAPPPLPRPMAADVAGLSAVELEHLQHLLNRRLGYMEGLQAFHELAYPRPASMPGPSVSPEALGAWNEALAAIQTLRQQQVPVPIPPNAPIEPTRVKTADIADLSRSQRERLRSRLRVELGTPRGRAVYADMAYRPLQGTVAPAITPEEMDIWRATLAEVRLPHSGARSVVVPELIDLGRHQLETLRRRMVNTLGEVRGSAVYKAKALRSSIERAPMDISVAEAQTWERLLAAARSHPYRHQPGPDIAADLADLSAAELGVLRIELKRRLGFHYGEDIYLARSRRTSDTRPAPVLSTEEANAWHEALAVARAARHAPPPATMAGDEVARRLWHVPRSDWPETIYYYAPAEDLEAISDMVILISQRRLGTVEANGIPLFTAPPSTLVNQMDSIASSWLPAGASDDLGSLTGAWLRIDLRAAAANIHPSFDLFRLGSAQGNAFVLRPTAQSASMGTGERALWLFGHYSAHRSPP